MSTLLRRALPFFVTLLAFSTPLVASAHEVYVLTPEQIARDVATPGFDMIAVLMSDLTRFAFWAFIGIFTVLVVFLLSVSRRLEKKLYPTLARAKKHAPAIARVTIGISFLAAAYFQATYGPELPLSQTYGSLSPLATIALLLIGIAITCNFFTRSAALVALAMYGIAVYFQGSYMLTYTNYLGEIVVLILGVHEGGARLKGLCGRVARIIGPYSFAILRVSFGTSLLYASFYAKILHNELAYQVASLPLAGHAYSVAYYLGFEPHFLVVGAAIVELVIGAFFFLGIEIRFTSVFLLFWLSLSLIFFGETVWPHIILIGIPLAFILHGYDRGSIEGRFFSKRHWEPVF